MTIRILWWRICDTYCSPSTRTIHITSGLITQVNGSNQLDSITGVLVMFLAGNPWRNWFWRLMIQRNVFTLILVNILWMIVYSQNFWANFGINRFYIKLANAGNWNALKIQSFILKWVLSKFLFLHFHFLNLENNKTAGYKDEAFFRAWMIQKVKFVKKIISIIRISTLEDVYKVLILFQVKTLGLTKQQ